MQNNNNNNQQAPQQPSNGNPASQEQYRAAMQQQQLAAMARLHAQQGGSAGAQQAPAQPQQQQQQQQQQQAGTSTAGSGGSSVTQAQMQLLQQLFHSNPEKLAEFITLSREGKISADHIAQIRGAAVAAQQAQQQGRAAGTGQQVRPAQPIQQHQQQTQARPPAQQAAAPIQQPQQAQPQQPAQAQMVNRPPEAAAQSAAQGGQAPPARDFSQIMVNIQKAAEPIVRRVKELEVALGIAQPKPNESASAPMPAGPERTKAEAELAEMKSKQVQLGQQFLAAKAQHLMQQGNKQEAQKIMQTLQQQQQQQQQRTAAARPTPRPPLPNTQAGGPQASAPGQAQGSPAGASRLTGVVGASAANSSSPSGAQRTSSTGVSAEAMVQRASGNISQMGTSVPATLSVTPSVPEPYPNANGPRPTLSQGLGTNPLLGTPAILQRPDPLSGSAAGMAAGGAGGAAGQANRWEDLVGVAPREGKFAGSDTRMSNANADDLGADAGRPEFWDSMTGNGTGAESLLNAGSSTTTPAAGGVAATSGGRLLTKRKVQELMGEIDPNERLEGAVEDLLLEIADEFIDSVTQFACRLAKHRKGDRLEARDVQLHLERNWNLRIPTPGSVPIPPPRIKTATQQGGAASKSGAGANAGANAQ